MSNPERAMATRLANIEKRTGKSIAELTAVVRNCGLTRHGQFVAHLKSPLGMGHGDANLLAHVAKQPASAGKAMNMLDTIYTGPKAEIARLAPLKSGSTMPPSCLRIPLQELQSPL